MGMICFMDIDRWIDLWLIVSCVLTMHRTKELISRINNTIQHLGPTTQITTPGIYNASHFAGF